MVLSSVLMIPLVLITRLIAYQSARDEGLEFVQRQVRCAKELLRSARQWIERKYVLIGKLLTNLSKLTTIFIDEGTGVHK